FPHVAAQQVADELADVVVDAAAFLHRGDDGGVVVVGQHHVRGFPGDVGARAAHGDADVGLFHRGRVVDAVTGHGHDLPGPPQRPHDAQLVVGRDAGEHGAAA